MRLTQLFLAATIVICAVTFGAVAYGQTPDLQAWQRTTDAAEAALETEGTAAIVLENLRARLSEQRAQALAIQESSAPRIETLRSQIAALGPAPAEGASEDADIAERRTLLEERLAAARAPLVEAEIAYNAADSLIAQIDAELRRRLADRLTRLGPSPVNPSNWSGALKDLSGIGNRLAQAFTFRLTGTEQRSAYIGGLPFAVLLLIAAAVAVFYVLPRLLRALTTAAVDRREGVRLWMLGYGRNAVRLAIPGAGAALTIAALRQMEPGGLGTHVMTNALPLAGLALVLSYFVGRGLMGTPADYAVIDRGEGPNRQGRRLIGLLGIALAALVLADAITSQPSFSDAGRVAVFLPLCVIGALILWPLGRILRRPPPSDPDTPDAPKITPNLPIVWYARIAMAVAIAAPVLAAIGYYNLASFIFAPTIWTLLIIGTLMIVYVVLRDSADVWLTASGDESRAQTRARFGLLPVAIGFALICVGLPILALIWGARTTDLQEIWIWLRDGVPIGDVRLSVTELLTFILVFAIGYAITRAVQALVRNSVLPRTSLDVGAKNAVLAGIGYIGVFLAALIAITSTGLDLSNLAIVAGALSVGIGFGLQTIVSNFVSGIILLIERPIKEGDWIEVAGFSGYVKGISVRSTIIQTFDKASVIVPNQELIAGTVLNRTHENLMGRVIVPVGVGYNSDPRQVEGILAGIADDHPMVLRNPPPAVVFAGFGADSLNFEIRAHIRDVNWMLSVTSDMNFAISEKFSEAGIEIPFAQRDVAIRNAGEVAKMLDKLRKES